MLGLEYHSGVEGVFASIRIVRKRIENAGTAFFEKHEAIKGIASDLPSRNTINKKTTNNSHVKSIIRVDLSRLHEILRSDNLFSRLNIKPTRSPEEIRTAFRKVACNYHPDKIKSQKPEKDAHKKFLEIQEAYEYLMNDEFRIAYLGGLEFDDSIPQKGSISSDDSFYKIFGDCFERNAIWSKNENVPLLGDENTDIKQVEYFYQFWSNFESIRDFTSVALEEIEQANDRYERRSVQRQRKRACKLLMENESKRIHDLIELTYKL